MNNPLKTRADVIQAVLSMLEPLVPCLTPGKARMIVSEGSAHYSEDVAGMEGFSRVLWAIVPMLMGRVPEVEPYWQLWREGIIHGTDPSHEEYWGDIGPYDQRMVEMAVIGMGLIFLPDRFYHELTPVQQDHLYAWLNQINLHDMPKNNWRFFRILVNTGFLKVGRPVDEVRLKEDLDMMEGHYVGDGWYFDYETKRDYYTLWAFHYYSLLYAAAMKDADPDRCRRFTERAQLIAPRFACWFDAEGRGLPYGRSLTYRFAQGAFFSAMAFAGVTAPGLGYGTLRHLWLQNLRFWLSMPIFDRGGALTVGYGYPNLCMAEGYNAPGSPYWGLKTFAALALPEDHPFWTEPETAFDAPGTFLDQQVRLLLTTPADHRQVVAYTAGNHGWEHMHEDEKYEKFAYSTHFTFSVAKESGTLEKGAYDSMLAVKRAGNDLWHVRSGCSSFSLTDRQVSFTWSPMESVTIETILVPAGEWHIRMHTIHTALPISIAEGAFAVRRDWAVARPCDRSASICESSDTSALVHGFCGSSAVFALRGYQKGEVIKTEPNTNLQYPRTMLPMLTGSLPAGDHVLMCAVFGDTADAAPSEVPQSVLALAAALYPGVG